jgi:CRP-like cAMP-binding protein
MVSNELLRRFPFFAGLSQEHLSTLAKISDEVNTEADHYFFREDDKLDCVHLILEGSVGIVFRLPKRNIRHKISEQFERELKSEDVIVSTLGLGDVFGWSGIVPPFKATAGAKSLTKCRVIAIQSNELLELFEDDYRFGYLMTQKAAQVIRDRLHTLRIETLAFNIEAP